MLNSLTFTVFNISNVKGEVNNNILSKIISFDYYLKKLTNLESKNILLYKKFWGATPSELIVLKFLFNPLKSHLDFKDPCYTQLNVWFILLNQIMS